jgi:flagellar biosynthesis protein FlhG
MFRLTTVSAANVQPTTNYKQSEALMPELLSIDEISRETGLEESLLRFYESEFPEEFPQKQWRGDGLAFDPKAVDSFKKVHALYSGQRQDGLASGRAAGRFARVIAVTSGKGGVGKTNIALNLAIEFQRFGKMCVLLDADLGMANVHLLAGLNPGHDIGEVLTGNRSVSEIVQDGPEGIGIIPGGGGILALADSTKQDRLRILRGLESIERKADIILVDTGAGMGASVRDFLKSADEVILVLTSEITSLADGYGLLKAMAQDREFAGKPLYTVINMANGLRQAAEAANRFSGCVKQFLNREVKSAGYILRDSTVSAATMRRIPYSVFKPQSRVSINTRNIAARLLKEEMPEIKLSSAFGRYLNMLMEQH